MVKVSKVCIQRPCARINPIGTYCRSIKLKDIINKVKSKQREKKNIQSHYSLIFNRNFLLSSGRHDISARKARNYNQEYFTKAKSIRSFNGDQSFPHMQVKNLGLAFSLATNASEFAWAGNIRERKEPKFPVIRVKMVISRLSIVT